MNEQSPASADILFEVANGIGKVTFNRPQARNAFTFAMYERLAEICQQANEDHSFKVLVFQGAGDKAFASGTDINQFRAFTTPQHALDYESRIDRVLTELERCRVPTIAAINGACTGGGAGIAACCDLRVGTKSVRMGFPIARNARQLPVDVEYQPAHSADRTGAGQRHHLYSAACRCRGSGQCRPAHRSRRGSAGSAEARR